MSASPVSSPSPFEEPAGSVPAAAAGGAGAPDSPSSEAVSSPPPLKSSSRKRQRATDDTPAADGDSNREFFNVDDDDEGAAADRGPVTAPRRHSESPRLSASAAGGTGTPQALSSLPPTAGEVAPVLVSSGSAEAADVTPAVDGNATVAGGGGVPTTSTTLPMTPQANALPVKGTPSVAKLSLRGAAAAGAIQSPAATLTTPNGQQGVDSGSPPPKSSSSGPLPPPSAPSTSAASKKELRQRTLDKYQPPPPTEVLLRRELDEKQGKIDAMLLRIASLEAELANTKSALVRHEEVITTLQQRDTKAREVLSAVMQDMARARRRDARRQQHAQHFELGHIITAPTSGGSFGGSSVRELWVEGNRTRELIRRQEELAVRESELEAERSTLERRLAVLRRQGGTTAAITDSLLRPASDELSNGLAAITDEAIEIEERLQAVRRELEVTVLAKDALRDECQQLEAEKKVFLKEIRRISEEDASEFATRTVVGQDHRYVLMELLGKGGFSEVWKAFDLHLMQYVACKIHKVGREMSPQQRQSYLRHAERELDIMRSLSHSRLTRLLDVFQPDNTNDAFVAVMEFCAGTDLDTFLKSRGSLKEADAKTIMLQIISALRHMADQTRPVIHYDLKPANVLFVRASQLSLEIKITDFGLSKIMSSAHDVAMNSRHAEGIELTSQGTGTYWYLPPECFDTTRTPTINGKVDVWAAGVIFYQMLFGRRPFAEGVSQRQIWQDKLITALASKPLEFPASAPGGGKVSDEAKAVIQRCLTANVYERCDIYQLSADPYFRKMGRSAGGGGGGGGSSGTGSASGSAGGGSRASGRATASIAAAAAVTATALHGGPVGVGAASPFPPTAEMPPPSS